MINNTEKFLSMLGLSRRAGKVIIGTPLVTSTLPSGKVKVTFYTSDASDNTKKRITDKCKFYNTECIIIDTSSSQIGKMVGMNTDVCVVGVTDDNFSKQLKALVQG
jgi:ribosomal protein L7Ae-like RNA K-turn-binding protein